MIPGPERERERVEFSDSPKEDTERAGVEGLLFAPWGCTAGLLALEIGRTDVSVLEAGEDGLVEVWAVIGFGLLRPVIELAEALARVGRRGMALSRGVETNCGVEVVVMFEEWLGEEDLLSLEFKFERPVKVGVVM